DRARLRADRAVCDRHGDRDRGAGARDRRARGRNPVRLGEGRGPAGPLNRLREELILADTRIPEDLHYSEQDEWARSEGERVTVGITDYAQQQLGDVVFVELPAVGSRLERGAPFGVIESVKAVSDLYAPIAGEVIGVNEALTSRPELVNEDCYGEGW